MELFFKSVYNHSAITADDLYEIMDAHERIEFRKGDMVLAEGQVMNAYYLIETGLFRAFVNNFDGKEITTEFYGQNQILIEVSSLFQRIPTQENLQVLADAVVWKIGSGFEGVLSYWASRTPRSVESEKKFMLIDKTCPRTSLFMF